MSEMSERLAKCTTAKSRHLGHCAVRSKMFSSIIKLTISALVLCPLAEADDFEDSVRKCCPAGQVVSIFDEFVCNVVEGEAQKLMYQFGFGSRVGFLCPESERVTITALEDVVEQPLLVGSACIDILYENDSPSGVHVIFQCGPSRSSEKAVATGSVALPELPDLRMCCDSGLMFDLLKRACVPENDFLQWRRELRLLWRHIDEMIPSSLLCRSNDTEEITFGSLPEKKFLTLRICCSIDKVYSVDRRDCVPKEGRWNEPRNFPFLEQEFDFVTVVRGVPPCKHALVDYVVDFRRDLRVKGDGRLELTLVTANGEETMIVNENNTCLDRGVSATSDLVVFRVCSDSRFCMEHPCVRKCCPDTQSSFWGTCNSIRGYTPPGHFHDVLLNESIARGAGHEDALNIHDYGLLIGIPCKMVTEWHKNWYISLRGYVYLSNGKVYKHNDYCLEMTYPDDSDDRGLYLGECIEIWPDYSFRIYLIHGIFESTSCALLIITLLVYICLPALRNLRGKILMCHVASLVVGYACFAMITLAPIPTKHCPSLGYVTFSSWISAFSWLNVLCFDMWWTLSGKVGQTTSEGHVDAYDKKFLLYSVYACGYTFLASLICIAIDRTEVVPRNLRPNIGIDSCWFSDDKTDYNNKLLLYGEIIFFIIPVSLQLVVNMIFFTLTARHCIRVKAQITKMTASSTEPRSQRFHAARKELIISIKMFTVMGLTFIFLLIFAVSLHYDLGMSWYLGFMFAQDVVNCLHGFTIFFLFVVNGRVYKALLNRMGRGSSNNISPADDAEAIRARREVPSLLPIATSG